MLEYVTNVCFSFFLCVGRWPLKVSVGFVLQHSSHISELLSHHNRCKMWGVTSKYIKHILPCELFVPIFLIFCHLFRAAGKVVKSFLLNYWSHRLQINKILRGKILFISKCFYSVRVRSHWRYHSTLGYTDWLESQIIYFWSRNNSISSGREQVRSVCQAGPLLTFWM